METQNYVQFNQIQGLFWVLIWAIFFLTLRYLKNQNEQRKLEMIHKERLLAIEKGLPFPELPEYESVPKKSMFIVTLDNMLRDNPRWPLGLGAICVMLGIGISLAFYLSSDDEYRRIWSFGLIGVFSGFGLFSYYFLTRRKAR